MNITMQARHFGLTEALEDHVQKGFARALGRFDNIGSIRVILEKSGANYEASATVNAGAEALHAAAASPDAYAAVGELADKVARQVVRQKARVSSHETIRHAQEEPVTEE